MNLPLSGKAALVTGAGSGIGEATAEELARAGAGVTLAGRRLAVLEAGASRLQAAGFQAMAVSTDVREFAQVERAVQRTVERFGSLDILVANAAIVDHTAIADADPDLWRDVIVTNVLGVMYSVRAALPQMDRQGTGHVVIVSSGSGRHTYVGEPAYVASKHATIAFADCLRKEVSPRGIRVTVLEPGLVDTPLIRSHPYALQTFPGVKPLDPIDCARAIAMAVTQPENCNLFEIALYPMGQVR